MSGTDFGHVHVGGCIPERETLSENTQLDVRVMLHDNPGQLDIFELVYHGADYETDVEFPQTPPFTCPSPGTCERWLQVPVDLSLFNHAGLQELRFRAFEDVPGGNNMIASLDWQVYVENGATRMDQTRLAVPRRQGWYTGSGSCEAGHTGAPLPQAPPSRRRAPPSCGDGNRPPRRPLPRLRVGRPPLLAPRRPRRRPPRQLRPLRLLVLPLLRQPRPQRQHQPLRQPRRLRPLQPRRRRHRLHPPRHHRQRRERTATAMVCLTSSTIAPTGQTPRKACPPGLCLSTIPTATGSARPSKRRWAQTRPSIAVSMLGRRTSTTIPSSISRISPQSACSSGSQCRQRQRDITSRRTHPTDSSTSRTLRHWACSSGGVARLKVDSVLDFDNAIEQGHKFFH